MFFVGFFFLCSLFFPFWLLLYSTLLFSGLSVCSSAPVSMKIQPLNKTALMVSWDRPLIVYHPPITSYMVSYSWVKRDVADEKTFTKTGDQRTVSIIYCLSEDVFWTARIVFSAPQMYFGRIRRWLDHWQCVEEVTDCNELCLWLLDDMRAQTLPCHSAVCE